MLKNYLKIALKVLRRNKLYTGISLFGISFTLMVLMLAAAILNAELGNNPPLGKKDKILFLNSLMGEGFKRKTETKYDTTEVNGVLKIDTIKTTKVLEGQSNLQSSSSLGYKFYKDKIAPMKTAIITSVFIDYTPMDVFPNGEKLSLNGNKTDENYWEIFDFQFIEGQPYGKQAVENQANVIVLRESVAEEYFGKQASYLGKEVIWGLNGPMKVVGIVKDINSSNRSVRADFFVPITWAKANELDYGFGYFGSCSAAILAAHKSDVPKMENELRTIESGLEKIDNYDRFTIFEKSAADIYAWGFMGSQKTRKGAEFLRIIFAVLFLFLLIPVLNLINLNVTRIFERSSEIGVRKSFGAKTKDLLMQFLFENLIVTFIGGVIGFILTFVLIKALNGSEVLGNTKLAFNYSLIGISILLTFIFGLLSGFLPAWRISKTAIVNALKSGKA